MSDENNLKRALIVNKGITELKEKIMKISEVMASFLDAETLVEGRLSEMESKNSDLWNVLKSYKKEIAELKENCKRMAVLNIDRDNKINRLLAKLDGEDRQPKTYKDLPQEEKERRWKEFNKRVREGYPEFDIYFLEEMEKKEVGFDGFLGSNEARKEHLKKDSGGDSIRGLVESNVCIHGNYLNDPCPECKPKPPEPSRCKSCGEILTHYSKNQRGELICPSCWIPKEPREDDVINLGDLLREKGILPQKADLIIVDFDKDYIIVKREDLQWLIERIDTYHISKEKDIYERIKEEYNV